LIREQFDSYLRRGMIDPVIPEKKVSDRRIPRFKFHNAHNQDKEKYEKAIKEIL